MLTYLKSLSSSARDYFKKYPFLGLDLGLNEIRLLQLEKRGSCFHIEKMVAHPFSVEKASRGKGSSWEAYREPLLDLVAQMELKNCSVALALPHSAIIKKQIELPPPLQESELTAVLQQGLSQYFPGIPENEIYFDYEVKPANEAWLSILLVATRKQQLQSQLSVVEQAGLKVAIVDVDIYALTRAAALFFYPNQERRNEIAVLLNLVSPVCSFIAFNAEELIFHHSWNVDKAIFDNPLDHGDNWVQQVKNGWQLYQSNHPQRKITFMGVAGEIVHLDQLVSVFQKQFSLTVKQVNPFQAMTHSASLRPNLINDYASRFLLCCGLARRGVK